MCQAQKTLAYAKALQHWAEEVRPPLLGKLHQLAECFHELQESMEPFTTFTDAKVFREVEPSNWVWVTPSKSSEPAECTPPHSQNSRTQVRDAGPMRGMGHLKPSATTPREGLSATLSPIPHEGTRTQLPTPLPVFGDIAGIL